MTVYPRTNIRFRFSYGTRRIWNQKWIMKNFEPKTEMEIITDSLSFTNEQRSFVYRLGIALNVRDFPVIPLSQSIPSFRIRIPHYSTLYVLTYTIFEIKFSSLILASFCTWHLHLHLNVMDLYILRTKNSQMMSIMWSNDFQSNLIRNEKRLSKS